MVSPELLAYIRDGLKEGFPITDIVEKLQEAGWEDADIRHAILLLQKEGVVVSVPPSLAGAGASNTQAAQSPSATGFPSSPTPPVSQSSLGPSEGGAAGAPSPTEDSGSGSLAATPSRPSSASSPSSPAPSASSPSPSASLPSQAAGPAQTPSLAPASPASVSQENGSFVTTNTPAAPALPNSTTLNPAPTTPFSAPQAAPQAGAAGPQQPSPSVMPPLSPERAPEAKQEASAPPTFPLPAAPANEPPFNQSAPLSESQALAENPAPVLRSEPASASGEKEAPFSSASATPAMPSRAVEPARPTPPRALTMPRTPQEAQALLASLHASKAKALATSPAQPSLPASNPSAPQPGAQPSLAASSPTPTAQNQSVLTPPASPMLPSTPQTSLAPPMPRGQTPPAAAIAPSQGGAQPQVAQTKRHPFLLRGILILLLGIVLGAAIALGSVCVVAPDALPLCGG